ncbi:MAG: cupin domain-containing protein [Gaiellaceae bacterium]
MTDSALALERRVVEGGGAASAGDREADTFVYVADGRGSISLGETGLLAARSAALVPAGEHAELNADEDLELVVMTVGPGVERHAPMGPRALTASLDAEAQQATGARSFQILFDASNGSTRATLFAGFVPPGRAPWHYHLYDEIVWVPDGPGRVHVGEAVEDLGPGSAFRLRPREVHIVENTSADRELTIIGLFTPAGSPSAAYLTPEVAAEYRFAG